MRKLLSMVLTGLVTLAPAVSTPEVSRENTVARFIEAYDRAFSAKDLRRLATFYDPDVTIFEGGHVNTGWPDYRDNHLGPELEGMEDLEYSHVQVVPHVFGEGHAYVTAEYRIKTKVSGKVVEAEGLETLVLVKEADAGWRIRHSHTSSRRKPAPSPAPGAND